MSPSMKAPLVAFFLLLSFAFNFQSSTNFALASCSCNCPADNPCPSNCGSCSTQSTSCSCNINCNSATCPSVGYTQTYYCLWSCCGIFTSGATKTCQRACTQGTGQCATCNSGYYGSSCAACPVCQNQGTCNSGFTGDGTCICPSGTAGPLCQYTDQGTCSGHGYAQASGACNCMKGWTGTNCNACDVGSGYYPNGAGGCTFCSSSGTCSSHGSCSSSGTCLCSPGYIGSNCGNCDLNNNYFPTAASTCVFCTPSATCNGQGTCNNDGSCNCKSNWGGNPTCSQCTTNYFGPTCSPCPPGLNLPACNGVGSCSWGLLGTGQCTCSALYAGADCSNPYITGMTPANGPTQGSTVITLSGHFFGSSGSVFLGTQLCQSATYTASSVTCSTPASVSGPVQVCLTRAQPSTTSNCLPYTYDSPVLSKLVPSNSPTVGGTRITLQGANFGTVQTVTLAGVNVNANLDTTVSTHTMLVLKSPSGVGAQLPVVVTVNGQATQPVNMQYDAPVLTQLSVLSGPTTGGTPLIIQGYNFGDVSLGSSLLSVTIGPYTCLSPTRLSLNSISCSTPPGAGLSAVVVTVSGQTSSSSSSSSPLFFTYFAPTLSGVTGCSLGAVYGVGTTAGCSPNGGVDRISITGSNFASSTIQQSLVVTVGSGSCSSLSIINSTFLTCLVPAGHGYNVSVTITRAMNGLTQSASSPALSYSCPLLLKNTLHLVTSTTLSSSAMSLSSFTVNSGAVLSTSTQGGDVLSMSGSFFGFNLSLISVNYGVPLSASSASSSSLSSIFAVSFPCVVSAVSGTSLTCTTTAGAGANLVFVVTVSGISSNIGVDTYSYPAPIITSSTLRLFGQPPSAVVTGNVTTGDVLQFQGKHFGTTATMMATMPTLLTVVYGPIMQLNEFVCFVNVALSTDSTITCKTSPGQGLLLNFTVTVGYGPSAQSVTGTDVYSYPQAPVVLSVSGCPVNTGSTTSNCPTSAVLTTKTTTSKITLTITGYNFLFTGALAVIGTQACINTQHVKGQEQTKLTCTLPAGTGINVPITVSNTNNAFSVAAPLLSYSAPVLSTVTGCPLDPVTSSIACPRYGGTIITLTGTNLGSTGGAVLVGGSPCLNISHSSSNPDSVVTCSMPSGVGAARSVLYVQQQGALTNQSITVDYAQCQPGTRALNLDCPQCNNGTFSNAYGMTFCFDCPVGTFSVSGASSCTSCSPGSFSGLPAQSSCQLCAPGSSAQNFEQTQCDQCDQGHASGVNGSSSCAPCPQGEFQGGTGASTCLLCQPGTYAASTGQSLCTPCPAGTCSSSPGSSFCSLCPLGTSSSGGSSNCTSCLAGYYADTTGSLQCKQCAQGRFADVSGRSTCEACAPGTMQASSGAPLCQQCLVGSQAPQPGATGCDPCPVGTVTAVNGTISCLPCSPGFVQPNLGQSTCAACLPGQFIDTIGQQKCSPCLQGFYSNSTGQSGCTACQAGSSANQTGNTICDLCSPGYYSSFTAQSTCSICQPGFASGVWGATSCSGCTAGSWSGTVGGTVCLLCASGSISPALASKCSLCAAGSYSGVNASTSCTLCEPGQFNAVAGQSACLLCPAGTTAVRGSITCTACLSGYYAPSPGSTACMPCPAGSYSLPGSNTAIGPITCTNCSAGSFSNSVASPSCLPCDPGSVTALSGATMCDKCTAGSFSNTSGLSVCYLCDAGLYNTALGQIGCLKCGEGSYQNATGSSSCQACLAGSYAPITGLSQCEPCPLGRYVNAGGAIDCKDCEVAKFSNATGQSGCSNCLAGTFASSFGSASCELCPAGTYADQEAFSTCLFCGVGRFAFLNGTVNCAPCGAGSYAASTGYSSCTSCSQGAFQPEQGATNCQECNPGQYQNVTGQSQCLACGLGTYQLNNGRAICDPCPPGYYTATTGLNGACSGCDIGSYASVPGSSACSACPSGSYSSLSKMTMCSLCAAGRFAASVGGSTCVDCPAGHYSSNVGSSNCTQCVAGTISDSGKSICSFCTPGTYALAGSSTCRTCGPFTISGAGAPSCTQCNSTSGQAVATDDAHLNCVCLAGDYLSLNGYTCVACPHGAQCDVGGLEQATLNVRAGFWRPSTTSLDFEQCILLEHCVGGFNSTCEANRVGPLCAVCAPGTKSATAFSTCSACPSSGASSGTTAALIFVVVIALLVLYGVVVRADWSLLQAERERDVNEVQFDTLDCKQAAMYDVAGTRAAEMVRRGGGGQGQVQGQRSASMDGVEMSTMTIENRVMRATSRAMYANVGINSTELKPTTANVTDSVVTETGSETGSTQGGDGVLSTSGVAAPTAAGVSGVSLPILSIGDGVLGPIRSLLDLEIPEGDDPLPFDVNELGSRSRANFTYKLKIVIGFLQIATSLVYVAEVPWPSYYVSFISALTLVNLDFIPWQSLSCSVSFSFYTKLLITTVSPIGVAVSLIIFFLLPMYALDYRDMSDSELSRRSRKRARRIFWKLILFTVFLLYPNVSSTVLSFFVCKQIPLTGGGTTYLLEADMTLECYDAQWMRYLSLAIIMTLVYPIGIPIFIAHRLYRYKDKLNLPGVKLELGFLYEAYAYDVFWFELLDMSHKLFLTSLVNFFPLSMQMPAALCGVTLYTMSLLIVRPYMRSSDDLLHLIVQVELFLFILIGFIISTTTNYQLDATTNVLLSALLISIVIAILVFFVAVAVLNIRKLYRRFQRRHIDRVLQEKVVAESIKMTSQAAFVNPLFQPKSSPQLSSSTMNVGVNSSPVTSSISATNADTNSNSDIPRAAPGSAAAAAAAAAAAPAPLNALTKAKLRRAPDVDDDVDDDDDELNDVDLASNANPLHAAHNRRHLPHVREMSLNESPSAAPEQEINRILSLSTNKIREKKMSEQILDQEREHQHQHEQRQHAHEQHEVALNVEAQAQAQAQGQHQHEHAHVRSHTQTGNMNMSVMARDTLDDEPGM